MPKLNLSSLLHSETISVITVSFGTLDQHKPTSIGIKRALVLTYSY